MKRVALFVGVNEYQDHKISPLRYAVKDAEQMRNIFAAGGYETHLLIGKSNLEIKKEVKKLCSTLQTGDIFAFYFSGHGHEVGGQTYLLCPDAESSTVDIDGGADAIALAAVRRICQMTAPPGITRLFILDCCRSHIISGAKGVYGSNISEKSIRMADSEAANDSGREIVMLACESGQCAYEDPKLQMGNFTKAMMETVKDLTIRSFEHFWNVLAGNLQKITREQSCKLSEYSQMDIPLFAHWENSSGTELSEDEKAEYFLYYTEVSDFFQQLMPPNIPQELQDMYDGMHEQFASVAETPERGSWDILSELQAKISDWGRMTREFPAADQIREQCGTLRDQLTGKFNWVESRDVDKLLRSAQKAYMEMAYPQAAALWHKTAGILRGELSRCQEAFEKQQEKLRREKAARERQQMINEALQKGSTALASCQWDAAAEQANLVLAVDPDNIAAAKLSNSVRLGRKKEEDAKNKKINDFYCAGMTALEKADFATAENCAAKIRDVFPDSHFAADLLEHSKELQERVARIEKELPEYQKLLVNQQYDQLADQMSQDFGILPEKLLNEIKKLKEVVLPVIEKRDLIFSIRKAIDKKQLQTAEKGLEKLRSIAPDDPEIDRLTRAGKRMEKQVLLQEIGRAVDAGQWAAADRLTDKLLAKYPECVNKVRKIYFSRLKKVDSSPDQDMFRKIGRHDMLCIKLDELELYDHPGGCKKSKCNQDFPFFRSDGFRAFVVIACWLLTAGVSVLLPVALRASDVHLDDGWGVLGCVASGGLTIGNIFILIKLAPENFPASSSGIIFFSSLFLGFAGFGCWIEACL